jgi:hypothetical protein
MVLIHKNYNDIEFIKLNALTILHASGPPHSLSLPNWIKANSDPRIRNNSYRDEFPRFPAIPNATAV